MTLDPFEGLTIIESTVFDETGGHTFVRCNQFGAYPYAYLATIHAEHVEHMRLILECAKAFKKVVQEAHRCRMYGEPEWRQCKSIMRMVDVIKASLSDPDLVEIVESWTNAEEKAPESGTVIALVPKSEAELVKVDGQYFIACKYGPTEEDADADTEANI